ncbi:hypothetical protein [Plantactinospora sonchi]|uniref:Chitin-binding type-3 domain-containing protein n=1 Tax=Plantactinospora sonchi TaxID=1544735 RepID=A0ABU7S586_9ACTN
MTIHPRTGPPLAVRRRWSARRTLIPLLVNTLLATAAVVSTPVSAVASDTGCARFGSSFDPEPIEGRSLSQAITRRVLGDSIGVWQAKWWTQGNIPGTGPDADHEPWKLIGPAN